MRVKQPQIRERLLEAAAAEFKDCGFAGASLRRIARRASVTTGSIYSYFGGKDELFTALVEPVVASIEAVLATDDIPFAEAAGRKAFNPEQWFTKNLDFLVQLIKQQRTGMELLLLKAAGSPFEDYTQELIEQGTARSVKVFRKLKRSRRFAGEQLSIFFVRNLVAHVINVAVNLLAQRCTDRELERYRREISAFLYSGWQALVELEAPASLPR